MTLPKARLLPLATGLLPALLIALPGHAEVPSSARQKELVHLVRQDCGSCHGMSLKGGLGPALLPAMLAERPAESMTATILFGRPGTPMPGWQRFVNESEAAWIVARLRDGFPEE